MFPDPESPTLTSRRVAGLARSLPFMQALHGQTVVIVDGGAANEARTRAAFAQDVALLALTGVRPVVVQGIPAASDTQSVHTAHAAMAGVNHELVRLIGSHGAKAIGIDGHDGGLLVATAESDGASTSTVAQFDGAALSAFLENGLVPVVMPVAPDDAGHDRLLRPERLGSLFAQRTGAVTLVMMVDSTLLRELGELAGLYGITELEQWLSEHPAADAAPCVREALDALAHGVQNVHLADIGQPESLIDELLTEEGSGVVFCRRGNTDLLSETRRYFADSACVLRDGFSVEKKPVVRF
ncbi:MAG: acetylglutamate kinase [Burkholderia sp.]|uniref:amino acid kinase family protein n=2 Tax=Pseudomonadota TaxID=1224 RepID=UPI00113062AE|nr:acetylglutamate kinase [Burkholderia arboris]MCA3777497.1 acetylglutamate kinase [Burkholderia sp.]MCA3789445.1 acetylglutamate kinase [Burkholderia sp.]MCA3792440.1 acetylglutamate kinase [Burkholderia sp.]MCA3803649.1 acetylglutamate kinase [Burkholderia sp.]MCA3812641.1 acetylglutamate kinase [Burkholderia sp.]